MAFGRDIAVATRIMVINDTQEILELFREILVDEGYEVALYSYSIQDMDEFERVRPDLIILDYMIGGEPLGWQILQKLKMRRSTANIPIVICTAASKAIQEMEGYLTTKDVAVVLKPFDIDDLVSAVKKALQVHESRAYPGVGEQDDESSAGDTANDS
jgi:DNA-binding response OmpR family regulator